MQGEIWEVYARPLEALSKMENVQRVSLAGDDLRAITQNGLTADRLKSRLEAQGLSVVGVRRGEPTLEDVFVSPAKD